MFFYYVENKKNTQVLWYLENHISHDNGYNSHISNIKEIVHFHFF